VLGLELRGHRRTSANWAKTKNMPEMGRRKKNKEKVFLLYKNIQTNEFKHEFEFKHSKNNAPACMQ
jgi:hypothetical protein